jgi:acyl-CoA synthetase (AMP-forming)/AMP-acid ligase II
MSWRLEKDISGFMVRRCAQAAARYAAAGHWRDETLAAIARARTEQDPARVLLIEGERRLTRGQAWTDALRLSRFFAARGLAPGDVISFQLPNWVEASVVSLAARISGLVVNPVPPIYREAELSYILGDCGAKLLFIPEVFRNVDYPSLIERVRNGLPALKDVVVVRGAARPGTIASPETIAWEEALDRAPLDDLPKVDPAAVMMAMYTSGTTSRPKGVLHSHQTYGFKIRQMAEVWGLAASDVFFMPSPLTHITGAFWCVDLPWLQGAASVLMDVWSPEEGVRCIEAHGCTVNGGATPFLQQLLDIGGRRPEAVASLRIFFCGGAAVSADLINAASATFPNCLFFRSYGCTETPTTTMGVRERAKARLGAETDGEVLAPTEVRMMDPEGSGEVADGEEGEIAVRGPEQFLGYLNVQNPGDFDEDGFFRTGDLGRRVHGDYLVITGRKKDIIIRSGENISPKEVEDILHQHPDILDVAIVAMPSPQTGEMGCAFIVPHGGAAIDLAEIRRFLDAAGLARQKYPEHVVLVDELPRVPSGKVRKDVLRADAAKIAAERT